MAVAPRAGAWIEMNMAKLAYIEYGVRSKNRAPKPIVLKAIKDATPEAERVMQKKIEELTQ